MFFYVGEDITQPAMLTKSILKADPAAHIIHCGDPQTPLIDGVSVRTNCDGDRRSLMSFRLRAFAELGLAEPAMYVDTDMLCMLPINSAALTEEYPVRFCARQFNLNWNFNGNFGGLDFSEFDQRPMGEVFPYVACATAATNSTVWIDLYAILGTLHPKFSLWYGDQEAMKRYCIAEGLTPDIGLPEYEYGCLPEYTDLAKTAALMHFKGAKRKDLMSAAFANMPE